MAQESENFGHEHPLILLTEGNDEQSTIQSEEKEACCFRCGEEVLSSAPRYSCAECSGFYLHKVCAKAPMEINHPFHPNHPLLLLQNNPYPSGGWRCDFCDKRGEKFAYHCSCGLDFHVKCALFTFNIAKGNKKDLEHVAYVDPTTKNDEQLENLGKCFGCTEPLANSVYISLDCGFNLHKKCAELPLKINHRCHRKHPLVLQFNGKRLPCKICQQTERRGLLYCCLPCEFAIHIQCVSPVFIVEDKIHQHIFTKFSRPAPFICDACGTEGNCIAYLCCECHIMVHEKCMSLPRIIKTRWHEHRICHTYFLHEENFKCSDCIVCLDEVNTEHGSYYCSDCQMFAHVNCATKREDWYYVVEEENEADGSLDLCPITVIETNDAGEATQIKHFKHDHTLMLGRVEMVEYDDKCCDGCILPISPPYFHCSEPTCNFFLHKACAELPKKKEVWFHNCQGEMLTLISDYVFICSSLQLSNGFGYKCNKCKEHVCLTCVSSLPQRPLNCPGHPHPLFFYYDYEGKCHGCGDEDITSTFAYYCKGCKFALCPGCLRLPTRAQHKCDEKHLLALTYHDDNEYSATHYCDICEETRDPSHWFYHCGTCNTCAHVNCVLGDEPFIKPGSIYKEEEKDYPHPPTVVKKLYYYPKCFGCDKPCQDLGLECSQPGCNFITHWSCRSEWETHVHSLEETSDEVAAVGHNS